MTVEMLVRRVDKTNKNTDIENAQCTKRGDVIAVKELGWQWSAVERNNVNWVVLVVEDMTVGDAEAFLQAEQPIAAAEAQPLLKRRMLDLDLNLLTESITTSEKENDYTPWNKPFNHTQAQVTSAVRVKAPAPVVLV